MASIYDFGLFNNHCAGCGKLIKSWAIDQSGKLPTVFCNSVCETDAKLKERMSENKPIDPIAQKLFSGR